MKEVVATVDARIRAAVSRMRAVARGTLTRVLFKDGRIISQIAGLSEEDDRDVSHLQQYGFCSYPHNGADAVVVFFGSPGARAVVATHDRRYILEGLQQGEVAIFTDEGDKVHLARGEIQIESKGNIKISASGDVSVEAGGNVVLDGASVEVGAGAGQQAVLGNMLQTLFNGHTHTVGAVPTSVPTTLMGPPQLASKAKVK